MRIFEGLERFLPMKKIVIFALSLMLFAFLYTNSVGFSIDDYNDVDSCLPQYENALRYIVEEKGVMGGTSATTFSPNAVLKRCDILVAFCRVFEVDVEVYEGYAIPFTDVPESAYYRNHVAWAYDNNIIGGTSHTTFSPNNAVNRQTACLIFDRFATHLNITLPDNGSIAVFNDDDEIGNIYKASVYKLFRAGIILGDHINNVNPTDDLQRVHFAVMLFRYYDPVVPDSAEIQPDKVMPLGIRVKWTEVPDVDGYQVRINGGEWVDILPQKPKLHRFSGLNPNSTYYIEIRSVLDYTNTRLSSDIIGVSVTTTDFIINVNSYYDKGYVVRYNNGFSNSYSTLSKNKIVDYTQAVCDRLESMFGFTMVINTPQLIESSIDSCKGTVTTSNINSLCLHNDPHTVCYGREFANSSLTQNNNSLYKFFNSHASAGAMNLNVLWSGHRMLHIEGLSGENRSSFCSRYGYNNIFLINIFSQPNITTYSEGALMHEMSHYIGAKDHYHEESYIYDKVTCKRTSDSKCCSDPSCNENNGTIYRPSSCLMNNGYQSITNSNVLCSGCKADMNEYIACHFDR